MILPEPQLQETQRQGGGRELLNVRREGVHEAPQLPLLQELGPKARCDDHNGPLLALGREALQPPAPHAQPLQLRLWVTVWEHKSSSLVLL